MKRRTAAVPAAVLVLASPVLAQGFVERASAVGLDHVFTSGLDRLGNAPVMTDWAQVGVAIGDLDGDGLPDLVALGHISPNSVFRNDGDGTFTDISAHAELQSEHFDNGIALGDWDGDGDKDAWLGSVLPNGPKAGTSRLYRNDGTAKFGDVTDLAGTRAHGHSIAGKFFDLDYDGDLDLLVSEFHGTSNAYYVNNGDGTFSERGAELGLDVGGSTHVTAIMDVDGDGYVDVLVGNDWRANVAFGITNNEDDIHLRNNGDGSFTDVTPGANFQHGGPDGTDIGSGTMGFTCADVDYDGDLDLYKTEQDDQFLMINNGWPAGGPWVQAQDAYGVTNATTPDPSQPGVSGPSVGWGCFFFDANRDRWEDLFKVNGHVGPNSYRDQQNYFFLSGGPGAGFTFTDQTAAFGLADNFDDRGLACGDLDLDGDVDLVVAPPAGNLRYFENQVVSSGGWLHITADTRTSAPGGRGTLLSWTDSLGFPHVRQIGSDAPTASDHEEMVYFGLGPETSIDLTAAFPSGLTRLYEDVQPNQRLVVVEPEMIRLSAKTFRPGSPLPTTPKVNPGSGVAPLAGASGASTGASAEWSLAAPAPSGGRIAPGGFAPSHLVVTAFAHDAQGAKLDGRANVTIDVPGLAPLGRVEYVGASVFRREFETDGAAPGTYRVAVSFDGFAVRIRPAVNVIGGLSQVESQCTVKPECVRGATADTFEIVFVPRDENGLRLGSGHAVEAEVLGFGGIPPTPMVDRGDGTYSVELGAPGTVGFKYISIHVDGTELFGIANLDVAFQPTAVNTIVYREDPAENIALLTNTFRFIVTPRDLFGLRVGPESTVDLEITPVPGTEPAYERTDLSPVLRDNGEIVFVIERDPASPFGSARGGLQVTVDGVVVVTTSYNF